MPFHWPLQRLLDVTDKRELAVKADLFDLSRRISLTRKEILDRRRRIRLVLADLASADLSERLLRREVLVRCGRSEEDVIAALANRVKELSVRRQEKVTELARITAKKNTLQKMRSEARRSYQRWLSLREQQRMDELFHTGYARRTLREQRRRSA
jgi:flagellar biosynthesis chaperone FliJ